MRDNLGGDLQGLKSSVEGLIISMGDAGLTAVFRTIIQMGTEIVRAFDDMVKGVSSAISAVNEFTGIGTAISTVFGTVSDVVGGVTGVVIASALALTAYMTPAIVAATGATWTFVAGLVATRGALMATGIGAIVVVAGMLINKLLTLSEQAGGLGNLWKQMSNLGVAAFNYVLAQGGVLYTGLQGWFAKIGSAWDGMVIGLQKSFKSFMETVNGWAASVPDWIPGAEALATATASAMESADAKIQSVQDRQAKAAADLSAAQTGAAQEAMIASANLAVAWNNLGAAGATVVGSGENTAQTITEVTDVLDTNTDSTDKNTKKQKSLTDQLQQQVQQWREQLSPIAKYKREMAELQQLSDKVVKGGLTADEVAAAQRSLNVELADSLPLVGNLTDAVTDGLWGGWKGVLSNMTSLFKQTISQWIAMAAKNQIVMSLGLTGTATTAATTATTAAASSSLQSAGTSALGSALAGSLSIVKEFVGGITGPLSAGIQTAMQNGLTAGWNSFSTTVNASASGMAGTAGALGTWAMGIGAGVGFGNLLSNGYSIGGISGNTASIAGTAVGAILGGPIGAAIGGALGGGLTALFGRKLKDTGIEGNFDDSGFTGNSYAYYKGGLFSSSKTKRSALDPTLDTAMDETIAAISLASKSAASSLGIAASAFDGFTYSIKFSTKGLTDEEISEKLQEVTSDMANAYAGMIDGLSDFQESGEGLSDTLTRLSTAITTVNGALDTLDYSFAYSGLKGAALADSLADLFGGTDAFTSSVSSYWDTFYSATEQQEILTRQATKTLAAYNVQLPTTRDAYRQLIDAQDLSTESGRALWAVLVQMSSVMDEILPTISSITDEIEGLLSTTSSALDDAIDSLTDLAKINQEAADDWYKVSDDVADLIADIRGTAGTVTTSAQALAYNTAQYKAAYAKAMSGDLDAAGEVAGLAKSYLSSVTASTSTRAEAAIAQAKTVAQLSALDNLSHKQGATFDTIAALQGQQITLLQTLSDLISSGNVDTSSILNAAVSGNGLTKAQIAEIQKNSGLSNAQVAALTSLNSLTGTGNGLSTSQLNALTSIKTLGASELQAFAVAIGALNTQTNTLGGSLVGIDKNVAKAVGSDNSAALLTTMKTASTDIKSVVTGIASLRSAMLEQGKISAVNSVLSDLETNSSGQTYLTSSDLSQLAAIYGIDTSGKSSSQIAKAIASYSDSDNISAGSYVLDLNGAKQAKKAALETQYEAAVAKLQQAVAAVVSFDAATGGDIVNSNGGVTQPYVTSAGIVAWDNGDPKSVSVASSSDLAKWKSTYWATNGLEDRMNAANSAVKTLKTKLAAYASGGSHSGGLRLVGEEGPELEVTGPSRIYSAGQTQNLLGAANDALIEEVRALKQQLAEMTVYSKKTAEQTTTTAKATRRATEMGWGTGA